MQQQIALEDIANANAQIAVESHESLADYLQSLDPQTWGDPTACTKWTVRDLANHVTAVALIFAGEARQTLEGGSSLPSWVRDAGLDAAKLEGLPPGEKVVAYIRRRGIDSLPPNEVVASMLGGVRSFADTISSAEVTQLQRPATVPFAQFPLFVLTTMLAI